MFPRRNGSARKRRRHETNTARALSEALKPLFWRERAKSGAILMCRRYLTTSGGSASAIE